MAKKAVATLHEGSTDGRAYSKVIKMIKSPKTGAYILSIHPFCIKEKRNELTILQVLLQGISG